MTITQPAGLDFDPATDPARGRHLVLACPWGGRIQAPNAHAGEKVTPDLFSLPDRKRLRAGVLPVNEDHNSYRRIGRIVDGIADEVGIWLLVELDDYDPTGLAVSLEAVRPGRATRAGVVVTGLAIVRHGVPAIPGSKVWDERSELPTWTTAAVPFEPDLSDLGKVARRADASGGTVVIDPGGVNAALRREREAIRNAPARPAMDLGAMREFNASMSMSEVRADVERVRRTYEAGRAFYAEERAEDEQRKTFDAWWYGDGGEQFRQAGRDADAVRLAEEARQAKAERERRDAVDRAEAERIAASRESVRAELAAARDAQRAREQAEWDRRERDRREAAQQAAEARRERLERARAARMARRRRRARTGPFWVVWHYITGSGK